MKSYSPFRSTTTFKPQSDCPDISIYTCPDCGKAYQALGRGEHTAPACCGKAMERLAPLKEDEFPAGYKVGYSIVGGLDYDAVKITWSSPEGDKPEWILLKTYTGSYIRYLGAKKKPPMIFALADEDAYVYCDKNICERCTFRCKLGFAVYLHYALPKPLLLEVGLDKVALRYQTKIL